MSYSLLEDFLSLRGMLIGIAYCEDCILVLDGLHLLESSIKFIDCMLHVIESLLSPLAVPATIPCLSNSCLQHPVQLGVPAWVGEEEGT